MTSSRKTQFELIGVTVALYTALLGNLAILVSFVCIILTVSLRFRLPDLGHMKTSSGRLGGLFIVYYGYFLCVSVAYSLDAERAFVETGPLLPFLFWGLVAVFTRANMQAAYLSRSAFHAMLSILIVVFIASVIHVVEPYLPKYLHSYTRPIGHSGRLEMYAGNPLPLGTLLFATSLFLFVGWEVKQRSLRVFAIIAFVLAFWTLMFWVQARGSVLGLVALLPLIIWKTRLTGVIKGRSLIVGISVTAGVVGLLSLAAYHLLQSSPRFVHGIATLLTSESYDNSVMVRLNLYGAGLQAFTDHWLFGAGAVDMLSSATPYFEPQNKNFGHFHNGFINHAVAGGIFGLGLFMAIVFSPILVLANPKARKNRDIVFFCIAVSAVAFLSALSNVLFFNHVQAYFFATFIFLTSRFGVRD